MEHDTLGELLASLPPRDTGDCDPSNGVVFNAAAGPSSVIGAIAILLIAFDQIDKGH